ncbi:MAG: NAD-dependent epimerase/dehydratase family protein [bacterium]|nr:NAD-dependent epimerase/dehydratase family protein [bacterium]
MAKYLVTGGAGFIGSHLVDQLISNGDKVIVLDNLFSGKRENINPAAHFYKADIRDAKKIKPFFAGVDGVFHLAAAASVPLSVKDTPLTSDINILGSVNVFTAAIESGVKKIVFASSSAVYGNQKSLPFKETMAPDPVSPYGWQKLSVESLGKLFSAMYRVPIISLRYFNIYGPRIDSASDYSLVIGKFIDCHAKKNPLPIFGSGKQTRDFCYVTDVVAANIKAMQGKKLKGGEVINIGGGQSYSVNQLSRLIGGKARRLPARSGDALHTKADITLAKRLLGWEPSFSFKEGLELTKEWFSNPKGAS